MMLLQIPEIEAALAKLYADGAYDEMLTCAEQVFLYLLTRKDIESRALFEHGADRILQEFSSKNFGRGLAKPRQGVVLHVATEVYAVGGHTRVFEDLVASLPECEHTLILTDSLGHYERGQMSLGVLEKRFADMGVRVRFLRRPGKLERLHELDQLIDIISPETIFINAHHFDVIAYGAIAGSRAPRVHFLHHCDYQPTLGATRTDYNHIDLTPNCHDYCKEFSGTDPQMLSMTVADPGVLPPASGSELIGVTSGSNNKYVGRVGFTYGELLVSLFNAGVTTMHHLGGLHEQVAQQLQAEIAAGGQDPRKLVFHGNVASLSVSMAAIQPTFYLNSHPTGGFKALIEVMALGLPFVHAFPPEKLPLYRWPEICGKAAIISSLDQAQSVVDTIAQNGRAWGEFNRQQYEAVFTPQLFKTNVRALAYPPELGMRAKSAS